MSEPRAFLSPRWWKAPAKVNLTLHVLGRRADGWHDLDSLVAFAGVYDWLYFAPGARLSLTVEGPGAADAGPVADNLVLRAARALGERVPDLTTGSFRLVKRLPVAAGLGGGSSDAAAALRALAFANRLSANDPRIWSAAEASGSDAPVCLAPRARRMSGRGEILGPPLELPGLFAALVNPRVAVATPTVFAALGLRAGERTGSAASPAPPARSSAAEAMIAVRAGRNELEAAARAIAPAIGNALDALARTQGALVVRMSGSGATCFALYEDRRSAIRAAAAIAAAHPTWWSKATILR